VAPALVALAHLPLSDKTVLEVLAAVVGVGRLVPEMRLPLLGLVLGTVSNRLPVLTVALVALSLTPLLTLARAVAVGVLAR
jgi:hypothetical protein